MKRLNKTESPRFFLLFALPFQSQRFSFLFYFTAAGDKCNVVTLKSLPVLHQSIDYIIYFWDHLAKFGCFENRKRFKLVLQPRKLHSCVWNDFTKPSLWFFFLLRVPCFLRQPLSCLLSSGLLFFVAIESICNNVAYCTHSMIHEWYKQIPCKGHTYWTEPS